MQALVVYESMYCNTHRVAQAVAEGLASSIELADVVEVCHSPRHIRADVGLLVVGGPSRAFTRRSTKPTGVPPTEVRPMRVCGIDLREWLDLVQIETPLRAAAFVTQASRRFRHAGAEVDRAHQRLTRLGASVIAPLASYYVVGKQGVLLDHQLQRAREWGEHLARAAQVPARSLPRAG